MQKGLWIAVLIIFALFFGLFILSQIPVAITQDEVFAAVSDAIAETNAIVDETEVEQVVNKALEKLAAPQKKRLKFLVSVYFVLWLIFSLYALRLAKMQAQLRKRLDGLQAGLQQQERG